MDHSSLPDTDTKDALSWVKLRLHDAETALWALRHWPDSGDTYQDLQAMRAYAERYFTERETP
jgi:hypothetical protein